MRIVKFGTKQCPACVAMDKSKVLQRFVERHPDVKLVLLDCADEEGEIPRGSVYETNDKLSDVYGVDSFPTLVFETNDGGELASWEGGVPMHELEKTYREAQKRHEAAQQIIKREATP